jgi:hypothetical protein
MTVTLFPAKDDSRGRTEANGEAGYAALPDYLAKGPVHRAGLVEGWKWGPSGSEGKGPRPSSATFAAWEFGRLATRKARHVFSRTSASLCAGNRDKSPMYDQQFGG